MRRKGAARTRVALGGWLLALAAFLPVRPAPAQTSGAEVVAIAHTVRDLDAAVTFYTTTLEFTRVADSVVEGAALERRFGVQGGRARVATLALGTERLQLYQFERPTPAAAVAAPAGNDGWFQHVAIIVSDMDRAWAQVLASGAVPISAGPQRIPDWNPAAGGIRAVYFRDPDGHPLELLWFPPGKGPARWQSRDRLFLGIDHTAINVRATAASERFYREELGLGVRGRSLNYGTEQERLSGVPQAMVRITGVGGTAGTGVEFLDYLRPGAGATTTMPLPPWDLHHWHIVLRTPMARGERLQRDPDGHAILVLPPTASAARVGRNN